jgi:hypothetical protein
MRMIPGALLLLLASTTVQGAKSWLTADAVIVRGADIVEVSLMELLWRALVIQLL